MDNLGTSNGSRVVELANGRNRITVVQGKTQSTAAVNAEGLPPSFLLL